MFQRLEVRVESVGEDVVLTMGNVAWRMNFETALTLSWWLRQRGRDAKRFAGAGSGFNMAGLMHDAEKGLNYGQPNNALPRVVRDLLKLNQIAVSQRGDLVVAQLGATTAQLPYQCALPLSQWLRVYAKQSKQRAGDLTRHWSAITSKCEPGVTRG